MNNDQDISKVFRRLHVPASSKLDERIHGEITEAVTPSAPELTFSEIIALLLKKKSTRYTLATTAGLALLVVFISNHSTSSAFAMDQAIDAIKKYRALHLTGYTIASDKTIPVDIWARSDTTGNWVETALGRVGDVTTWTSNGKTTYAYDRAEKKGYVEPGINGFFNPWFGPELLAVFARMKDYKAMEGNDPATGQRRVVVSCSLQNVAGPQSFLMEFDARTKLLVSMKSWLNLTREGTPQISLENFLYFEDLPDSVFSFQPPAGTQFTDTGGFGSDPSSFE